MAAMDIFKHSRLINHKSVIYPLEKLITDVNIHKSIVQYVARILQSQEFQKNPTVYIKNMRDSCVCYDTDDISKMPARGQKIMGSAFVLEYMSNRNNTAFEK